MNVAGPFPLPANARQEASGKGAHDPGNDEHPDELKDVSSWDPAVIHASYRAVVEDVLIEARRVG